MVTVTVTVMVTVMMMVMMVIVKAMIPNATDMEPTTIVVQGIPSSHTVLVCYRVYLHCLHYL
ncbi:hypothetical protein LPJ62_002546 [Coemansia sp. RSA 2167]|nr:hypothetical protein LPJ62_002546 [Coemansia sp. RSA 2167]